jgi:hypothetical protein
MICKIINTSILFGFIEWKQAKQKTNK